MREGTCVTTHCIQSAHIPAMSEAVLVPVLTDEYFRPVELVDFYVSNILDRRKTAEAVKLLSDCQPLGKFQHLKRVRNIGGKDSPLQILLCPLNKELDPNDSTLISDNAAKDSASSEVLCSANPHAQKCVLDADGSVSNWREKTTEQSALCIESFNSEQSSDLNLISDSCRIRHHEKSTFSQSCATINGNSGCSAKEISQHSVTNCKHDCTVKEKDSCQTGCEADGDSLPQRTRTGVTVRSLLQRQVQDGVFSKPYLVKVPRHGPLTRKQFEETKLYWPVTFHEDKRIAKLVSGKFFTASEVNQIKAYLQQADVMATHAQQKGQGSVGVVIVDSAKDTVIARGHSLTGDNPLMHAAMVAVDLVARSQGGGMWDMTDSTKDPAAPDVTTETSSKTKSGPYLCTGYHVYMTEEPCPMCSMALLHSRVSRVFYSQPRRDGALGSRYKLHTLPSLNHHFDVFRFTTHLHSQQIAS
ncbi:probable inactive tRNA-specific adenosine deaminase-like protein 3 isoform X2 [Littorina saxatilis]|uniref:probable inactive tRNA-specific adenosine deaminase-like protein 3 isoform X2 n=1 Tax=Littorina saxatilis TaxID=31220 RepID=UPI0038B66F93